MARLGLITGISLLVAALVSEAGAKTVRVALVSNFNTISNNTLNPYTNSFRNGVTLALEQSKAELKGRDISVETLDFNIGDDAQSIRESAPKVLASDAIAVIGYHTSAAALLAGPSFEQGRMVMISPSASGNRVFELGPHVYSISYSNASQATALANYAISTLRAKKIAMIVANDCAYCADLASSFAGEAKKHKNVALSTFPILEQARDYSAVVKTVKQQNPDVVFIPNYEVASARLVGELTSEGYKGSFIGGDGWNNANGARFLQGGIGKVDGVFVGHWDVELKTPTNASFRSKYQKKFGTVPDVDAALGFDAMGLLLQNLLTANKLDREGVQEAMKAATSYSGVTGDLRLANGRFASKTAPLFRVNTTKSKFEIMRLLEMKSAK